MTQTKNCDMPPVLKKPAAYSAQKAEYTEVSRMLLTRSERIDIMYVVCVFHHNHNMRRENKNA